MYSTSFEYYAEADSIARAGVPNYGYGTGAQAQHGASAKNAQAVGAPIGAMPAGYWGSEGPIGASEDRVEGVGTLAAAQEQRQCMLGAFWCNMLGPPASLRKIQSKYNLLVGSLRKIQMQIQFVHARRSLQNMFT